MKIRSGFVSNSSSSSFLIYGVEIDQPDDISEFPLYHGDYDYNHYMGIEWDQVGDNETGAEFKARVVQEVNAARLERGLETIPAGEFGTCSHAWYDG